MDIKSESDPPFLGSHKIVNVLKNLFNFPLKEKYKLYSFSKTTIWANLRKKEILKYYTVIFVIILAVTLHDIMYKSTEQYLLNGYWINFNSTSTQIILLTWPFYFFPFCLILSASFPYSHYFLINLTGLFLQRNTKGFCIHSHMFITHLILHPPQKKNIYI